MEVRKGCVIINVDNEFANQEYVQLLIGAIAFIIKGICNKKCIKFTQFIAEKLLAVSEDCRTYLKIETTRR